MQIMTMRYGCEPTAIDLTPGEGSWPTGTSPWNVADYTAGNGTNHSGNGQCAMFDPRGGGMLFKPVPNDALYSITTGQFTSNFGANDSILSAFAGYPMFFASACIYGTGTCTTTGVTNPYSTLSYRITYLSYNVCKQIDTILNINFDPKSYEMVMENYSQTLFNNFNNYFKANSVLVGGNGIYPYTGMPTEGCANEYYANNHWSNGVYTYLCPVFIR